MDLAQGTDADFRGWIDGGDLRRAGEWLVHRYAGEVIGLCTAMIRDREAAADLTQDVFGRAFGALEGFRGEASTRTWLLQIARNRCLDHLRARRRDPWAGAAAEERDPDLHPDDAPLPPDLILRRADVEEALDELSEGERALVVLRFKSGLDYDELAHAFGLREGTVRMRISRALAKMRAALDPTGTELAAYPVAGVAPRAPAASQSAISRPPRRTPPAPACLETPPEADREATPMPRSTAPTGGFVARLRAAFGGPPGAPPSAPPDHPLARFFAAVAEDDRPLRDRLLARARSLA